MSDEKKNETQMVSLAQVKEIVADLIKENTPQAPRQDSNYTPWMQDSLKPGVLTDFTELAEAKVGDELDTQWGSGKVFQEERGGTKNKFNVNVLEDLQIPARLVVSETKDGKKRITLELKGISTGRFTDAVAVLKMLCGRDNDRGYSVVYGSEYQRQG